jgi:hypothetical protein
MVNLFQASVRGYYCSKSSPHVFMTKRKLLSSRWINVVTGRALYIFRPLCFYGYSFEYERAVDLHKLCGKELTKRLGRVSAWRTQDGWFVPGRDRRWVWGLNIPGSVRVPDIGMTPEGYYTCKGQVILAERVSIAQLELERLFL